MSATRSAGASSICRPRRPALTRIVSHASARLVDRRRQPPALTERADPARPRSRWRAPRSAGRRASPACRASAGRAGGDGHDATSSRPSTAATSVLKRRAGVDPERLRRRDRVVAGARIVVVLVQLEGCRLLRRGDAGASPSASPGELLGQQPEEKSAPGELDVAARQKRRLARGAAPARAGRARRSRLELLTPLVGVEIGGERLDRAVVDRRLAMWIAAGGTSRSARRRAPRRSSSSSSTRGPRRRRAPSSAPGPARRAALERGEQFAQGVDAHGAYAIAMRRSGEAGEPALRARRSRSRPSSRRARSAPARSARSWR